MKIEAKTLVGPDEIKPTKPIMRVRGVFNPAAVRLPNRKIMLYARVAETPRHDEVTFLAPRFTGGKSMKITLEKFNRRHMEICPDCSILKNEIYRLPTISHFRKILLDESGMFVESVSDKPDFYGVKDDGDFGIEDARITHLRKEKRYAMTYVSVSTDSGVSTALATSRNLRDWKRHGIIFRQQNKDVAIFPEKINGYYVALHRPEGTMIFDKPSIWVSYSRDLIFWGRDEPVMKPRKKGWDDLRVGSGHVPLKTPEGWLQVYHGVRLSKKSNPDSHKVYSAGAVLLDLKNPSRVIARSPANKPLFGPTLASEKKGFNDKVVFPTAVIPDLSGKNVLVYGGAADSSISVRKISLKSMLNSLK